VRTVFIEVRGEMADTVLVEVQLVLNERLAGMSLADIRQSLGLRLRDVHTSAGSVDLLNIFVQEANALFDVASPSEESVLLGEASLLVDKPEFASGEAMRKLIALTDKQNQLATLLRQRAASGGMSITIGAEHENALLGGLTVITAEYRAGALSGVIGVIGPTRMPYEKVIAVVRHASQLVEEVLA
jgi:heat-inducible transcriptional repressor